MKYPYSARHWVDCIRCAKQFREMGDHPRAAYWLWAASVYRSFCIAERQLVKGA